MKTLTPEQAYVAMFHFLEGYYQRSNWDQLGIILGSMSLLEDGSPADSAISADWQEAVEFSLSGGKTPYLSLGSKTDTR